MNHKYQLMNHFDFFSFHFISFFFFFEQYEQYCLPKYSRPITFLFSLMLFEIPFLKYSLIEYCHNPHGCALNSKVTTQLAY